MPTLAQRRERYWRRAQRFGAAILAIWFVLTFGFSWFARELSANFFGWPFSYWMGAQGAPLASLVLVLVHAARMDRFDREHGLADADDGSAGS